MDEGRVHAGLELRVDSSTCGVFESGDRNYRVGIRHCETATKAQVILDVDDHEGGFHRAAANELVAYAPRKGSFRVAVGVVSRDDLPRLFGEFRKVLSQALPHQSVKLVIRQHPVELEGLIDAASEKLFLQPESFDIGVRQ